MAVSVVMPALELAQETGKVLVWIKKEGDQVVKGEPLLEIETDKVSFELEAPADGILAGVRSHEGDVVPVGQIIAWLVAPGEQPPVESDTASRGMAEQARPMTASSASAAAACSRLCATCESAGPRESRQKPAGWLKRRASTSRRFAAQVPAESITGEDVLEAAAEAPAAPAPNLSARSRV